MPYVSVAFCNRNDNYGGDQIARIEKFIEYYEHFVNRLPDLFEFVICDWNPPPDRPSLAKSYDWNRLGVVSHYVVPPEVHKVYAGERGRPMLDYIGRNACIRRANCPFTLVLNQDIYCSEGVLEFIANQRLSPSCYYRADRCDFDFQSVQNVPPDRVEEMALKAAFVLNRRHDSRGSEISPQVTGDTIDAASSKPERPEWLHEAAGVLYCPNMRRQITWEYYRNGMLKPEVFRRQFLHTNAAGDFILAPTESFHRIHGMPETNEFYMHLDTYAVAQLCAAGYQQAIFAPPNRVFHADHSREGRADFREPITWAEHEDHLAGMLVGEEPFQFNDADWGLGQYDLSPAE